MCRSYHPVARFVHSRRVTCSGLGHSNKSHAGLWVRITCPDAEQLDPYYVGHCHAVGYTVESHRESPQAVTEAGYPAVEAYHAVKGPINRRTSGRRRLSRCTDKLEKCGTKFHPTYTKPRLRGPSFQSLLHENSKHGRNYEAAHAFKRILLENNEGTSIITHGVSMPPVLRGFTSTAAAVVGGHVGRERGGKVATTVAARCGSMAVTPPGVGAVDEGKEENVKRLQAAALRSEGARERHTADASVVDDWVRRPA